jgi:putative membrane protein
MSHSQKPRLSRGIVAGAAAGLVAAWVMNQFLAAWTKAEKALQDPTEAKQPQGEDSTEMVADAIVHSFTGRHLNKADKQKAGPIVHYAFGSLMGGVYGAIAEYSPQSRRSFGTLFGTVLFVGADEIVVPALGLGKPPTEEPLSSQAAHWAAHMVYGATVEAVRRGLRRMM